MEGYIGEDNQIVWNNQRQSDRLIIQKPTQVNIPNLLSQWQTKAGFIEKLFENESFVNKNVHLYQIWEIWEIKQIKLTMKDNRANYCYLDLPKLYVVSRSCCRNLLEMHIYIYIYIHIHTRVIPRHIFLSLKQNRRPKCRTGRF